MAGNTPIADVVDAPTIGTATAGVESATVTYTAAATGGTATTFTATSNPGSLTGTGASPITVSGLTASTAYTFTVRGSNSTGTSPASAASNSVTPTAAPSFESIASVTVSSGGASSISFTSIPLTYTNLQIRGIGRTSDASTGGNLATYIRFNSDSGNNYAFHQLSGSGGGTVGAGGGQSQNLIYTIHAGPRGNDLANTFSAQIIDILDYKNTSKYKTVRVLGGHDMNNTTAQRMALNSGLWMSTSAITRIDIYLESTMAQYTQFALYGIKGS